jgi:AAA family ATP:ADP antiporter
MLSGPSNFPEELMSANPLTRLLQRVAKVEAEEIPAVITAFLLFFCVLGGYFMVRPVRETVGTILGPDRVADLFGITWIASIAVVPAYGWLCSRYRRSAFLPGIYAFVAASFMAVGLLLRTTDNNVAAATFFYVFISVINLFVVSVFWSFLLELFNPGQTKRLFGAIAAGGTAGALVGPFTTSLVVAKIGHPGILFMGGGLFIAAILFQRILLGIGARQQWSAEGSAVSLDRPMGGNPFAGFSLVLRSPYLLGITAFVVLLATVTTFLYLEQLRIVDAAFPDDIQKTIVFSRLDYTVQSLTILTQLFFTGRLASRFGVGVLLTLVPIIMVGGFLTLAASGTFAVLAFVMIARRAGEYAFVRPGREMLFANVDTETKYKAKNLIDVPVYRGGDYVAGQVETGLTSSGWSSSAIAMLGAAVALVWAATGFLLGRARNEPKRAEPAEPVAAR